MGLNKVFILALGLIVLSGCSTNRKSTFALMAVSSGVGALAGSASAPSGEKKSSHAALWGAIGATAGAIVGQYHFDSERELRIREKELEGWKLKLETYEKKYEPKLTQEGKSTFRSDIPSDIQHLINPGKWKRYELDQWVQSSGNKNIWYRQTEMFEVIPPSVGGGK